jgi:hydroxybutyrate-dimer hydrolase
MSRKTVRIPRRLPAAAAAALLCLQLAGCWGDDDDTPFNTLPAGITDVSHTAYPATARGSGATADTQDLLTGGIGRTGLASATAPAYAGATPTAAELRRNALYSNYRGLVDTSTNGGFGSIYGPNVDLAGNASSSEGLVPGVEYIGVLDNAGGTKRVTMAVQVPTSFDQGNPCIVVAPSSGSRGVYGAIGTAGEWALKRGCAVALTDAGKGIGLHDLTDNSVTHIDGTRGVLAATDATTPVTAQSANFFAQLTDTARAAFLALFPNRVALKHAHSQQNPEKDWGNDTLAAARYALWVINDQYGTAVAGFPNKLVRYTPANTLVIAASVSNGGSAVLRAAEADTEGLIDAVVAGEPGATPANAAAYGVQQGGVPVGGYGKPLLDYFTYANLYQPCAALAAEASMGAEASFHNYISTFGLTARAQSRCTALAANGLVTGADLASQATDALNKLRGYGWGTYNDTMHSAHFGLGATTQVASMYANAYGRFSVADNLCNYSFAGVDALATSPTFGSPVALTDAAKAVSFATGNGVANGVPAAVLVNNSLGGAKRWDLVVSPSTGQADLGFDAAVCLRALVTGTDPRTNAPLTTTSVPTLDQSQRVRAGMAEVLANANLRGKPTLVVAGRNDALLPVNNAGRAYAAANKVAEGTGSKLSYIEVTNGQHFDTFLSLSGFDTRYVPLHAYFVDALNAMYANLKSGTALPPSQVVRAVQRGGTAGAAPAISRALNLPAISAAPAATDAVGFSGTAINVPN